MSEVTFSVNRSILTVVPGVKETGPVKIAKRALVEAVANRTEKLTDYDTDVTKILDALQPQEREQVFTRACPGMKTGIEGYVQNKSAAAAHAKKRNVFLVLTIVLLAAGGLGIKLNLPSKVLTALFSVGAVAGLLAGLQIIRGATQSNLAKAFESASPRVIWDYNGKYLEEVQEALK